MISATNISIRYGERVLFDKVSFIIDKQDKVGLVGRNGAGKSTLLHVLARRRTPDEGQVHWPNDVRVALLTQDLHLDPDATVMEEALKAFAEVQELEAELDRLNEEIAQRTDYESEAYHALLDRVAHLTERLGVLGHAQMEGEAVRVLCGLGFRQEELQRPVRTFSGGWQMRVELARILLSRPEYLLLDEPTNHLDIEAIIWLEDFLKNYPGAVVVISHDKQFLDRVTNRTIEIELGKVYDYKAPYSKYLELRAERREKLQAAYENQQRLIAQRERTINRFMAKATKTRMAQSMQKQLDKMERIELDETDERVMKLRFPPAPRAGQVVAEAKNLKKYYGNKRVLDGVHFRIERGERVAFVGQNGQGKTTLARIIVGELAPTDGELVLGHNVQTGYYAQNQSEVLDGDETVLETMERQAPPELRPRVRTILGSFMFSGEEVDKKVRVLSGGERARLALACLLLKPFNLLVLDEPTNHLDIPAKEVLKEALLQYDGALIVVSHDRDFLAGLTERTIEFRDHRLHEYLGDVNYFLEKRRLDDMRAVEQGHGAPAVSEEKERSERPERGAEWYEQRKKLMRTVRNVEKKIEKLEAEIAALEARMAEADFYEQPDHEDRLRHYGALKRQLEEAMEVWEEAQLKLEAFGQ